MHCIVGLGNPGKKFERTRHNAGFIIAKRFAGDSEFRFDSLANAQLALVDNDCVFLPLTFMNESGSSVKTYCKNHRLSIEQLLVIHDDLDLEFGKFKFSFDATAAGHNGVQSIIDHVGSQKFWRLRYGIAGAKKGSVPGEAYVLKKFSKDEFASLSTDEEIISAIKTFVTDGPEKAMQHFHTKNRH